MKIDLSELERKLSYGINLTIKESTILLESMEGFIDDKIELQEQLNTAKKALTEIINANDNLFLNIDGRGDYKRALSNAREALAAIGGDDGQ